MMVVFNVTVMRGPGTRNGGWQGRDRMDQGCPRSRLVPNGRESVGCCVDGHPRVGAWVPLAKTQRYEMDSVQKGASGKKPVTPALAGSPLDELLAGQWLSPRVCSAPTAAIHPTTLSTRRRSSIRTPMAFSVRHHAPEKATEGANCDTFYIHAGPQETKKVTTSRSTGAVRQGPAKNNCEKCG